MPQFSIYDRLLQESAAPTVTVKDVEKLGTTLTSLPPDLLELVFMLIIHHAIINKHSSAAEVAAGKLPYGGNMMSSTAGMQFRVMSLDSKLLLILQCLVDDLSK